MSLERICVRKEKLKCPKIPHCPKIPVVTLNVHTKQYSSLSIKLKGVGGGWFESNVIANPKTGCLASGLIYHLRPCDSS